MQACCNDYRTTDNRTHRSAFRTHRAGIVFANGGGLRPTRVQALLVRHRSTFRTHHTSTFSNRASLQGLSHSAFAATIGFSFMLISNPCLRGACGRCGILIFAIAVKTYRCCKTMPWQDGESFENRHTALFGARIPPLSTQLRGLH